MLYVSTCELHLKLFLQIEFYFKRLNINELDFQLKSSEKEYERNSQKVKGMK